MRELGASFGDAGFRERAGVLVRSQFSCEVIEVQVSSKRTSFFLNYGIASDACTDIEGSPVDFELQGRVRFKDSSEIDMADALNPDLFSAAREQASSLFNVFHKEERLLQELRSADPGVAFWPAAEENCVIGWSALKAASFLSDHAEYKLALEWAKVALSVVPKVAKGRRKRVEKLISDLTDR
ncbi:hypothetical protein HCZ30_06260 [Marivivens donghaensis]|uniref:DUF4304 domain-containing protein n=1 Tax=Marivivens donghaensis TaxID=1699413 RepID=A0ABX0VVD4_9RHOB|nr:hypothetical protein [Marivivens donghaensis]NIY72038.1 hypothetical protein [Marivivens donghaensis]